MTDRDVTYPDHELAENDSKLLDSLAQFDKSQRIKKPERYEPTLEVSEFHLLKHGVSDKDTVRIRDLAGSLGKKGHHADLTKKVQYARQKSKLLRKPLVKSEAEKIQRAVAYESAKKGLSKWDAIITKNRTATSVRFPLRQLSAEPQDSKDSAKRYRIQSQLETELAALQPIEEAKSNEKTKDYAITLKEAIMKKQEIAKTRAQQSYREAKAHRQKKIKSKKFHRIQKKGQIKQKMNELEALQKTNPEAALEVLAQLDKVRAEERMLLRHKSTGQWARNKQIRAKYDKDTRQELAAQLSISRELTQKVSNDSDIDEEEGEGVPIQASQSNKENPWVNSEKSEQEIDEFVKSYRAYWDQNSQSTEGKLVKGNVKGSGVSVKGNKQNNDGNSIINKTEASCADVKTLDTTKIAVSSTTQEVKSNSSSIPKSSNEEDNNFVATSNWDVAPVKRKTTSADKTAKKISKKTVKSGRLTSLNVDVKKGKCEENIKQQPVKKKKKTVINEGPSIKKRKAGANQGNDVYKGLRGTDKKKRPVLDVPLDETVDSNHNQTASRLEALKSATSALNEVDARIPETKNKESEIDPNKYISVKTKHLHTELPDANGLEADVIDDNDDNGEDEYNIVSEAFAGDDVVQEFKQEKQSVIQKSQPKSIDLTLPGWGSWGGKSIKVSKRKQKRFIIKFPKPETRRDENKGAVIIFEGTKTKMNDHQVNELPYPFTTVKDFEASMRMPIGRNFVPENSYMKLIKPKVKTKMGEIIEPMTEDVLVNTKPIKGAKLLNKNTIHPQKNHIRRTKK